MPDISELPIRYPIYRKFRYDAQFCQVMLYTYTDKDGFVPPSQVNGGGLTTGEGGPHSYLEEAVVNMPRNVATPSINAESSGRDGGGGEGAQPGAVAGAGKGGDHQPGVSETAGVIQAHLTREDRFKVILRLAHATYPCVVGRYMFVAVTS